MTRTLLRDESPGEVRTGLVEDGKLVEFRIQRSRQRNSLSGARFAARLLYRNGGKTFVELDRHFEAQLENAPDLPLGARLDVEIVRPPIPEPGRWKGALVRPVREEVNRSSMSDDIVVVGDRQAIDEAGFDELSEAAVSGEFAIEGGLLSIERTRAMTMIDIDGGGDALALNLTAAREIPRLLRLLDIGGQTGIDFLALPDRKARLAVDTALGEACANLGPHERTAINGFGFAQIVRPRPGPSIPEILCGITPGRLSIESRAIVLLRDASRSVGHGKRQLVAPPAIIELLRNWPEEIAALRSSLGVEIELVPDLQATGYGYVHANP